MYRRVVVIVGVSVAAIAAVLVFMFWAGEMDAPRKTTAATVYGIGQGINAYRVKHGRLPSREEGIKVLFPEFISSAAPKDRWDREIVYVPNSDKSSRPFELYSRGENGIDEKGTGDDIEYWSLSNRKK